MKLTFVTLSIAAISVSLIAAASSPIDCFGVGGLYGSDSNGTPVDDGDLIDQLSKDHVITSITGCTTDNGYAQGIQVTYGVWD